MKEETMFKMKRSASAEVRKKFQEMNELVPLSVNDVMEAVIFFFVDEDVNRSWMYFINAKKEQGVEYLKPEERREFLLDLSAQAMKKFTYELDPSSRLLMMGAGQFRDTINWHMKFPDTLVSNFRLNGTYGCIDGRPRSGKTALAVNLMKIINERFNYDIITNIVIDEKPDWIKYVQKLSDMVVEMQRSDDFVCVLDETGTFVGRKRALSVENVDFENLARFIGKMNGRLILITHSFELDVPTILQSWTSEKYTKIKLEQVKVVLSREGGFVKMNKLITGVPDAEMKFRTEDITSLHFDISIKQLLQEIQDGISIDKAIEHQVQKVKSKRERIDPKQIKAMVQDKVFNGLKVTEAIKEVAEEIGLTYTTIKGYYYTS